MTSQIYLRELSWHKYQRFFTWQSHPKHMTNFDDLRPLSARQLVAKFGL